VGALPIIFIVRVLRASRASDRSLLIPSEAARCASTEDHQAPCENKMYREPFVELCHHRCITVSLEVEELVGHLFGGERVEHGHDPPCEFEV
jgi:hypothetical protein